MAYYYYSMKNYLLERIYVFSVIGLCIGAFLFALIEFNQSEPVPIHRYLSVALVGVTGVVVSGQAYYIWKQKLKLQSQLRGTEFLVQSFAEKVNYTPPRIFARRFGKVVHSITIVLGFVLAIVGFVGFGFEMLLLSIVYFQSKTILELSYLLNQLSEKSIEEIVSQTT